MADAGRKQLEKLLKDRKLLGKECLPEDVDRLVAKGYFSERLLGAASQETFEELGLSSALAGLMVVEFGAGGHLRVGMQAPVIVTPAAGPGRRRCWVMCRRVGLQV